MYTEQHKLIMEAYENAILFEASLKQLKKIYIDTKKIPEHIFNEIVELDSSDTNKYTQWMIKRYLDKNEDRRTIINIFKDLIPKFHKLAKNKILKQGKNDIQKYKTTESLYDMLKYYEDDKLTKSQLSKGVKDFEKDIDPKDLVWENDKVVIVEPSRRDRSCKYGAGTKWCTSARGHSNYFNSYYDRGVRLFYILPKDKSDKQGKVAVAVLENGKELFDKEDEHLTLSQFNKILKDWDVPEF